eukprot:6213212-Pleurochrysis_carterae.AAC.1
MTCIQPATRCAPMSPSRCIPLQRSGATTAAVLRRRRMIRSAIVPSSPFSCICADSSDSKSGGDGAMSSSSSAMSALPLDDCGAVGGSACGVRGKVGGIGGGDCARPGKVVSMNRT